MFFVCYLWIPMLYCVCKDTIPDDTINGIFDGDDKKKSKMVILRKEWVINDSVYIFDVYEWVKCENKWNVKLLISIWISLRFSAKMIFMYHRQGTHPFNPMGNDSKVCTCCNVTIVLFLTVLWNSCLSICVDTPTKKKFLKSASGID